MTTFTDAVFNGPDLLAVLAFLAFAAYLSQPVRQP